MVMIKKKETRQSSSDCDNIVSTCPPSPSMRSHVCVKLLLSFFLIGIAFRLLISNSSTFPPSAPAKFPSRDGGSAHADEQIEQLADPVEEAASSASDETSVDSGKCDLFVGDWVPDSSTPFYTNSSCLDMEHHQNCMKNGRPDSGYLYWKWSPRRCSLPKFDPERFLDFMRNKSMALIGDSISRNHVQSLFCTLTQVEAAVETYHDKDYRSRTWTFPSYNFSIGVIWTPFLLKAAIFENINGISTRDIEIHLDKLDETWTDRFRSIDYAIIAGGKWFLKTAIYHENNTVTGCHYCPGKNLTELGYDYAYRRALQLVLSFVTSSKHKPSLLLRTTTPDHFENGEWFSGGTCNRTVPFKDGEVQLNDVDTLMREIELEEVAKISSIAANNGVTIKLLDTTQLSLMRPDGHPGPYREYHPSLQKSKVQNDCLHWCLPGPIDSWNDIVMELFLNADAYR